MCTSGSSALFPATVWGSGCPPPPHPSFRTQGANPLRGTQQIEGSAVLSSTPRPMGAAIQPCVPRKEEAPACPVPSQLHVGAPTPMPICHLGTEAYRIKYHLKLLQTVTNYQPAPSMEIPSELWLKALENTVFV